MKIAPGLTLLAIGAIFAFAVRTNPPGLNIHTMGWVIMLTGVAGLLLPARASGWLRRRIVLRRDPAGPDIGETGDDGPYPSYVLRDPAALASAILRDAELAGAADDASEDVPGPAPADQAGEQATAPAGTLDDLLGGRPGPGLRRP
ncbi:MAG TPA: hypothetical protein VK162_21800 [Streptosporangiaceae bacterium]|nr:hypothetical protein [Streptosporangiaceae bacterium]